MFTLTVRDEQVYRRLMERVEQRGESLDEVLRDLLEQGNQSNEDIKLTDRGEDQQAEEETPARKLLRLIDAADLPFTNSFDARDAEDIMRHEAGDFSWRDARDNDGSS